jgi:3-oxoacyl-[acyl-carrier protein] reductase
MKKEISFPEGVALIIGGTGGIGQAVSKLFSLSGSEVAITYNSNKTKAMELQKEFYLSSKKDSIFNLDITKEKEVESILNQVISLYGRIHTIINCAGFDIKQELVADLSIKSFQEVIKSDVYGFFNIVNKSIGHMKKQGGSYIFMSSAGLLKYPPGDILSVVPKAAIEELLKGIAKEEGGNNVRANSIALGIVDAGIFHRLKSQNDSFFDDEWEAALMQALPLKRYAEANEVAELALFLASNQASYITGQTIAIDGGYSI